MATATERRFTSLRKRLDQLGYRQPLGVESLPLVEKLFGDLLHTTESLKGTKQQLGKQKEQKVVWEQHVEPYRNDNARLVKENNELHQQIIRLKENLEQRVRELKASLRRLEHENADLKFLNTQYLQKLRTQEKESLSKTEKILELQEKNFQAVIQTPGGKRKHIPFRRQRMDIDSTVPKGAPTTQKPPRKITTPDPYVVDLLQVADQRMADLQGLLEAGQKERKTMEQSISSMRKQIENREVEIERLTEMLKGGRPPEALAAEGARASNERIVAHLNIQIDFLQQANRELEGKLSVSEGEREGAEQRAKDLAEKNSRICSELEEISELVKQMEREKETAETKMKESIVLLQEEKTTLTVSLEKFQLELHKIKGEKGELLVDNQRMAELLSASEGDSQEAGQVMERLNEERRSLQSHCRQLRDNEAALAERVRELESCSSATTVGGGISEVKRLRKERDELKEAVRNFETELTQIQMDTKMLAEDRDNFKLLYEQVSEEVGRLRSQSRAASSSSGPAVLVRRIEGERDDVKLELRQVKAECKSLRDRLKGLQDGHHHDLAGMDDRIAELQLQLDEVCGERDELSDRVKSLKEMVKSLETELQSSSAALKVTNEEASRYRSKANQLQGIVESAERTRQQQQKGIKKQATSMQEAQATITRLTSRNGQLEGELLKKEERIAELHHALTMLDQEHDALRAEVDTKAEDMEQLSQQIKEKDEHIEELERRVRELETELRGSRGENGRRGEELEGLRQEMRMAQREMEQLKTQLNTASQHEQELRQDLTTMTQENRAIHDELQRAASEKESLQLKVQEYAQTLLRYEETMAAKDREKVELLESYQSLSNEADRLDSTVQQSLGENSSVRIELATLAQEKAHLEDVVQQQATEIQQHIQSLQSYEFQLSNMTAALAKLEGALRQEQEEKKALIADITATRDLCVQLERTKESLSRQISSHSASYEQIHARLEDLTAERDLIRQQLSGERATVEKLQSLLSAERQKEFQAHISGQEKETEIQHLRQQLSRLEADRLSLGEQLRTLRSEVKLKGEEIQRLKSELASERFQREHAKQQLVSQRAQLTLTTAKRLVESPQGRELTHPTTATPTDPSGAVLSQTNGEQKREEKTEEEREGGGDMFSQERESVATYSARVVGELLSTSSSSNSSDNQPT